MKQYVTRTEWYPVFSIANPDTEYEREQSIEVPDDVVAEYRAALDAFDKAEDKIRKLYEASFNR